VDKSLIACLLALAAMALPGEADKHLPAQPATMPATESQPISTGGEDALPGVVELSDGRVLAGWLATIVEKPFSVYVEQTKTWRRIPLECVLGITAVVVEEKMELAWRPKGMGEPQKVYTGRQYPTRRLKWRFHLIDDSYVEGAVKGQPLWIEHGGGRLGPYVLHERMAGREGQELKDLTYVKRIIVSRRLMEQVLGERAAPGAPAGRRRRKIVRRKWWHSSIWPICVLWAKL
jgi:hypothetical protein